MTQSMLLLGAWGTLGVFGNRIVRFSRLHSLVLHVAALGIVVELFSSFGSESTTIVLRYIGLVAVVLIPILSMISRFVLPLSNSVQPTSRYSGSQKTWGALLAVPFLTLVAVRVADTRSFAWWYSVEIDTFRSNEDNAKWLGATSQLLVGEAPGVEAIGGVLIVLLRGALALADLLAVLGVRTLVSELYAVTFAVQFVRELLVVTSPLLFLRVAQINAPLRQRVVRLGPVVILSLIIQSLTFAYGFLSLQVSLMLGSLWLALRVRDAPANALNTLLTLLVGVSFCLSWLPLRLLLPIFVAVSVSHDFKRASKILRYTSLLLATVILLPTFRYVLGIHPNQGEDTPYFEYTRSLLQAGGGVFSISQWLVLFGTATVVGKYIADGKKLSLGRIEQIYIVFVAGVLLADLVLSGALGYGSTKLFVLTVFLISVWASMASVDSLGLTTVTRAISFIVVATLFMTASSYGVGFGLWGSHLRSLISPTPSASYVDVRSRVGDPEVVANDFGRLGAALQEMDLCTRTSCDLDTLPRSCLAIYVDSRKQMMQTRQITLVDTITGDSLLLYLCTRFLSEVSHGSASKTNLQNRFYFAGGERLRDSLVDIARMHPETRFLVAREGKARFEIRTAAELRTLALRVFPLIPNCDFSRHPIPPKAGCIR